MPDQARGIRVLVVDDHSVVRAGICRLLHASPGFDVVGDEADGAAAVERSTELVPDVVLMDLSMPVLDGVEATRSIVARHPGIAVLMLTSFADDDEVLRALDAGAAGFIIKDCEPDELLSAVRAAAAGDAPLDPRAARAVLHERRRSTSTDRPTLTRREQEVLEAIGRGLSNKLIARDLGISEKTVKAHLTRIYGALGVSDRTQAALWLQRSDARRSDG